MQPPAGDAWTDAGPSADAAALADGDESARPGGGSSGCAIDPRSPGAMWPAGPPLALVLLLLLRAAARCGAVDRPRSGPPFH